jgi:hypothetical protein
MCRRSNGDDCEGGGMLPEAAETCASNGDEKDDVAMQRARWKHNRERKRPGCAASEETLILVS